MSDLQTTKIDELFRTLPKNSGLDPRLIEEAKTELDMLKFRAGVHVQSHKQNSWSKSDSEQLQDKLQEKETEILLLKRQLQNRDSKSAGNGDVNSRLVIKIKDNYKRLYEQEWDETYSYFKLQGWGEIEIIVTLQRILRATYSFCRDVAREQLENIEGEALYPSAAWMDDDAILTRMKQRQITQEISELARLYQRTTAQECVSALQKAFIDHVLPTFIDPSRYSNKITKHYTKKCVDISWTMCIQDPPMLFLDKLDRGAEFDDETFRKYTNTGGDKFDYLVWPAMVLHQDGPLLVKGVAQPIKLGPSDDRLSDMGNIVPSRNSDSRIKYSRMSKDADDIDEFDSVSRRGTPQTPPQVYKRGTPQTPPQVYKRAQSRDDNIAPTSPFFDPHASRKDRTPQGTSPIPAIHVSDHDSRRSRQGRAETVYPDEGNLTVAWKNKRDNRVPSAP